MKAILITLLTVLTAFAAAGCTTNPATGEKQLSLISEEQEIQLGREAAPEVERQFGGVHPDYGINDYVARVGGALVAECERPYLPWTFKVVNSTDVNAFALPGGFIYVTRGLLLVMDNEAQLACVLGHEIGHVTARHSVDQLQKALGLEILIAAVGTGTDSPDAEAVARVVAALTQLKFSRDDEYQADELGVRYAVRGMYNPQGMIDLLGIFLALPSTSGGTLGDIFSTHPDTQKRIERVRKILKDDYPGVADNPMYKANTAEYRTQVDRIR